MNGNFFLRFMKLTAFVVCLLLPYSSNAQELSANWWNNNMIIAEGHGFPPSNIENAYSARSFSRRAAVTDGYRTLAEQIKGVHITAETTIESQIISGDIVESKVAAVIRGAEILSEEYDEYGGCKVIMGIPLFGAEDSVAKIVFKPVDKEDFPPPSEEKILEGNYTGLIIDCGDSDLKPVLSPVIRNTDNLSVYCYKNLDHDRVISNGVVGYVKKDAAVMGRKNTINISCADLIKRKLMFLNSSVEENNLSRAGDNPLIIKAERMSDGNSCPVISKEDADKILAENQASHFLDEGAVVFVNYKIGALRA